MCSEIGMVFYKKCHFNSYALSKVSDNNLVAVDEKVQLRALTDFYEK